MRFPANLGFPWPDRPLAARIRAAAAAGFDAIEVHFPCDEPPEEIRAALRGTGLPLLSLNTRPGDPVVGLAPVGGSWTVPGSSPNSPRRAGTAPSGRSTGRGERPGRGSAGSRGSGARPPGGGPRGAGAVPAQPVWSRICFQIAVSSQSANSRRRPQGPNSAWLIPMT